MAIPNIDTFEQDIREEIKHKEATIGDIASASGEIGNMPSNVGTFSNSKNSTDNNSSRGFYISTIIISILVISVLSYLGYLYTVQQSATKINKVTDNQNNSIDTPEIITKKLNDFAPSLSEGISRFTTKVETAPYGTIISINDYDSVFAFMIKSETDIAKEVLANELKNYENSTTTPDLTFIDNTKSNQNMREVIVGSTTLVYAFISDQYLVFASSTESIIKIRGNIIR